MLPMGGDDDTSWRSEHSDEEYPGNMMLPSDIWQVPSEIWQVPRLKSPLRIKLKCDTNYVNCCLIFKKSRGFGVAHAALSYYPALSSMFDILKWVKLFLIVCCYFVNWIILFSKTLYCHCLNNVKHWARIIVTYYAFTVWSNYKSAMIIW